ncbi:MULTISPECIES: hypothetical protein [Proteus]|uniref:hypothetical protein n=1 Tax=Proteus TaxID=583 RepID=UPI00288B860A|nr:hypothetical protein [Proteus columbae]
MKRNEIIKSFNLLNNNDKLKSLLDFSSTLDLDLALFFISIAMDKSEDIDVRIEAIKIVGLYKGKYNDTEIKKQLTLLILSTNEDEEIKIYSINTLSILDMDDDTLSLSQKIIMGNDYILVKEAAFSLISSHKKLPLAKNILSSMISHKIFGKSAQRELKN